MKFLLPTGIGDSVWALHKIQSVHDKQCPGEPIHVSLVGSENNIDSRALDFVKRFSFVDSADMKPHCIHNGTLYQPDGTYNYIEDGWYDFNGERYCVLIPNAALEHGIRLEDWLPQYEINWDIWKDFHISEWERQIVKELPQPYAVFYPGPLNGNTRDGHNRNAIWKPQDWLNLGSRIQSELGLDIVAVGAPYDAEYYNLLLNPILGDDAAFWTNLIGQTNLGQLWSVTSAAKFVISYQAGVGIISTYLGTPTGIFWRQHGDSINPYALLTFDNRMASAWVPPAILKAGTHLPLYYGKSSVDSILNEVRLRGWHETPAHSAVPAGK
jgi:hypothetical protein